MSTPESNSNTKPAVTEAVEIDPIDKANTGHLRVEVHDDESETGDEFTSQEPDPRVSAEDASEGGDETPDNPEEAPAEEKADEEPAPAAEDIEQGLEAIEKLPEFSEENAAAYDQRYVKEDGKPNLEQWTEDFYALQAAGKGLSEGHYKYLEAAHGLDKEGVDEIIEGQLAKAEKRGSGELKDLGVDQKTFDEALAWGVKNYSEDQKKRFNAAIEGKDPAARKEAVELLLARKAKATATEAPALRRPLRGVNPQRSAASKGASAAPASGAVKPFENRAEEQAALRAARGDKHLEAEYDKRLAATMAIGK
jgi:hypothetical protein